MPNSNKQTGARRAVRILVALKGASITGRSNSEIAKMINDSAPNVSRTLTALVEEGMAIQLDTGRYALGTRLLQIAAAHLTEMDRAAQKLAEINQRVSAGAR